VINSSILTHNTPLMLYLLANMIKAVIFDMDGTLIDTEPIWVEAEVHVLSELGVSINHSNVTETTGMRIDQVVKYWHNKHPWSSPTIQDVVAKILEQVEKYIIDHAQALPGAKETVKLCKEAGYTLAVASSSPKSLIDLDIEKLQIKRYIDVAHSGYDEIHGKPDPATFLSTARKLAVEPEECAVFEDSINGVTAAKRAGMFCVAVPPKNVDLKKYHEADVILGSLLDFDIESIKE